MAIAEFHEDEVTYESVEVSLDQPPVRAVAVECEVPWTQTVAGRGLPFLRNWVVYTLAGKGLIDGWPKPTIVVGGASYRVRAERRNRQGHESRRRVVRVPSFGA